MGPPAPFRMNIYQLEINPPEQLPFSPYSASPSRTNRSYTSHAPWNEAKRARAWRTEIAGLIFRTYTAPRRLALCALLLTGSCNSDPNVEVDFPPDATLEPP